MVQLWTMLNASSIVAIDSEEEKRGRVCMDGELEAETMVQYMLHDRVKWEAVWSFAVTVSVKREEERFIQREVAEQQNIAL